MFEFRLALSLQIGMAILSYAEAAIWRTRTREDDVAALGKRLALTVQEPVCCDSVKLRNLLQVLVGRAGLATLPRDDCLPYNSNPFGHLFGREASPFAGLSQPVAKEFSSIRSQVNQLQG